LVRTSAGVRPTAAGMTLLGEARAVLARHAHAVRTMAEYTTEGTGVIRLGIPLELPPSVLSGTLSRFAADCPHARVVSKYLSTAAQFAALRSDDLDVGLVRERPAGSEFDAMLVVRESLGILIDSDVAAKLGGAERISLEALGGMDWVGFPKTHSPAWYDQLAAIFRTHGIDVGPSSEDDQVLIPL
jgi:DNA-binding transcriptional LysR family regulator